MSKNVAIIGIGQTTYEKRKLKQNREEMIFEAATKALADAGITREQVDSVVLDAYDLADGVAIASATSAAPAGAHNKDETRLSDDGAFAVCLAYMEIMSGLSNITLVVAWHKNCGDWNLITNLSFEPFCQRPFALNQVTTDAIQVVKFMEKYGFTEEHAAKVIVRNRLHAANNPLADKKTPLTVKDIMKSRAVAWPLKELDLPPDSEGACAMVLASEDYVDRNRKVAWIKGLGWAADSYYLGNRDLAELGSLKIAANMAYRMAGIDKPAEQIDVAEICGSTAYHELAAYQALGFCGVGEVAKLVESDEYFNRKPHVNPSGGITSSNPHAASGLVRVAEAALQVMGRAEKRQVKNTKNALAHGIGGMCNQCNCILVLAANRVKNG
ncbi:MAG: thiolase family protein [Dehalococcoidia bacterium]|jgi:acetyl-CoA C-acetyltransferase